MIARVQELLLSAISSSPVLERLAAASIDLIVVTVAVAAVTALVRIRSRRVVALLWMVALVKPVLSLAVGAPAPIIPIATPSVETAPVSLSPAMEEEREMVVTGTDGRVVAISQERTTPLPAAFVAHTDESTGAGTIASIAWISGVVLMLGLSLLERLRLRRIIRTSYPAGDDVAARCRRIAAPFRAGRTPPVRVTAALESPALAGTLRPVVLLPEWITLRGHDERLEWALRHELAHWHSRDHLFALAAEVTRALFFFHPLAWWAARRWREAMEMACDESVVTGGRDVKRYAEQLYQILAHVDERRRLALSPSLFATRTQIGRRIESLLRTKHRVARPGAAAVAAVGVFAVASFAAGADFTPRPPLAPQAPATPTVVEGELVAARGSAHYDNVNLFETTDERELQLRAEGIEFERGSGRVLRLDEDGFLRVWEKTADTERHVYVTSDADGELRYRYRVDGQHRDWDEEAKQWLARVLRQHLTRVRNHAELVAAPPAAPAPVVAPVPRPAPGAEPAVAPSPPSTPEPDAAPAPPEEREPRARREAPGDE